MHSKDAECILMFLSAMPRGVSVAHIYVAFTLTILTEHGNLSLSSWYLRVKLSFLMRFKTCEFGQINILFLFLKKILK